MNEKQANQSNGNKSLNDSLTFEIIHGNGNVVKAISFDDGKKHEVYIYVISEEEFENLIPESEKMEAQK